MRRWRFIFPIIVLVIVIIAGYGVVSNRRIAVNRMFDEAGRKGEPIIFFKVSRPSFLCYVLSPNHEPVRLFSRDMGPKLYYPVFSQDGTLHLLQEYSSPFPEHVNRWEIAFPDIHTYQSDGWSTDFFGGLNSIDFPVFGSDKFLLGISDDEYKILEIESGEYTNNIFETPPPFRLYSPVNFSPEIFKISPDKTVIVARESYSTGFLLWNIWRYDIPEGAWSEVLEKQEGHLIIVGPEGRVMGISNTQVTPHETNFVDGVTGELLHTVLNIHGCIIDDRWIACQPIMGSGELLLIDMEDDWKEYRIDLDTYGIMNIAMYIPPPGGVEEMLAMREAE